MMRCYFRRGVSRRSLSTPATAPAAETKKACIFNFLSTYFIHEVKTINIPLRQVFGGLKDQDRIFTNLYGEKV